MTISSVSVLSETYILDPRPRFSFRVVAKRYWIDGCPDANKDMASSPRTKASGDVTLVFVHGLGTHKEHWEPTIQRLFEHQKTGVGASVRFHDMWSIDLLNHGDSAVLNEEVLRWGYDIFAWEDHARGIHAFLAGLGTGVDVDFSKRKLVLVSHSMGAVAAMLATTYYPLLEISSLHLIEPGLLGKQAQDFFSPLAERTRARRDIWSGPEEAFRSLKARPAWQIWDDRILRIFVEHGLRPLPTAEYPDQKEGVTLKCTKKQEAAHCEDKRSCTVGYHLLPHVLKKMPTHITQGTISDFIPRKWQQDILHVASGGITNFASVTSVPGAGHMIIQSHPDVVADIIWKSMTQPYVPENFILAKL